MRVTGAAIVYKCRGRRLLARQVLRAHVPRSNGHCTKETHAMYGRAGRHSRRGKEAHLGRLRGEAGGLEPKMCDVHAIVEASRLLNKLATDDLPAPVRRMLIHARQLLDDDIEAYFNPPNGGDRCLPERRSREARAWESGHPSHLESASS